jgi:hypothetical protein
VPQNRVPITDFLVRSNKHTRRYSTSLAQFVQCPEVCRLKCGIPTSKIILCISLDFPLASMPRPAEDNPASYPMGTWGPFPQVKRGRGVTLTIQHHLVPTSRMSRIYSSSPPQRLHGGSGTDLFYTSTDRTNGTQRNTTKIVTKLGYLDNYLV